jgi:anti-sigma factor RsiW
MTASSCAEAADLLPDRALGILDPADEAALDAHLAGCQRCRQDDAELASVVGRLAATVPGPPPPADLAERALARVRAAAAEATAPPGSAASDRSARTAPTPAPGRRRRKLILAAAAAVVVAVLAAGIAVGRTLAPDDVPVASSVPGLRAGELVTGEGRAVGTAVVTDPDRMALLLTAGREGITYGCRVVLDDGSTVDLGSWPSQEGGSSWAGTLPVASERVRAVEVTRADGTVWAATQLG